MIYTGIAESLFLVFPDATSMLLDCGDTNPHTFMAKRFGPKELPILPYYGYAAQLCTPDGTRERLKVGLGPNKLLSVHIPRERASGVISVRYEATFLQRLSQVVSIVSGIAFLSLFIVLKRRRRKVEREA